MVLHPQVMECLQKSNNMVPTGRFGAQQLNAWAPVFGHQPVAEEASIDVLMAAWREVPDPQAQLIGDHYDRVFQNIMWSEQRRHDMRLYKDSETGGQASILVAEGDDEPDFETTAYVGGWLQKKLNTSTADKGINCKNPIRTTSGRQVTQ